MTDSFARQHYPLDLHCGRSIWNRADLLTYYRQQPRPGRTFFRHLLADQVCHHSSDPVTAAELEMLATLNQVLRRVAATFLTRRQCRVGMGGIGLAGRSHEMPGLSVMFRSFLQCFPALPVELQHADIASYLGTLEEKGQLTDLLLEAVLLLVQSRNPALAGLRHLFADDEEQLQRSSNYRRQLEELDEQLPELDDGFAVQPQRLLARLLAPLLQRTSLSEQLLLLREVWGSLLPPELQARIGAALEQYATEGHQPGFPGEPETTPFDPGAAGEAEYASFTPDLDWMPRTVLLAKSTFVWLEQLSRTYQRPIRTLDQIPDEELDALRSYGFTSLWLIGIWKRSAASLKVKTLCGQSHIAASAYAIDDYCIAEELGGEAAFEQLRHRCRQRGLDLACDVVTNHTGIESAWLRDYPERFVQLPYAPYPGYRFTGPDLSSDPAYQIQIEDGYYDHSEAAVVCRYQHRHSGQVRYLYHGNDGTHLPWNDTVQLDYLRRDVREAMIRLIIRVAQRFRIIRFDAAMTLAKKHFQRLWYPLPGGGAGVPSRADHAMSRAEFDRLFPVEFWRELVDRVQLEAPDTLLIAEAFWLMEGYFVRTLGMHRVYNSAFMNMLKKEENAKYRQTLKNILAFDPAILQRFVNFMSNPDEKPAIEQFGDGGKYFCVATLLATMPGLPMFGHGQLEGYREKYGMEYLAPRWDEPVNQGLLKHHHATIFPLLRRRALFSGAAHFQLYDFVSAFGVEEDVFAYSNQLGDERVLVLCNNSDKQISGRVGRPVPMAGREGREVGSACAIDTSGDFILLTDLASRRQYLQPAKALAAGGNFSLEPYAALVLTDFSGRTDTDGRWQRLWQRYGSQGVRDLWLEYDGLLLENSWPIMDELLALTRPRQARRKIQALLYRLADGCDLAALRALPPAYLLEVLVGTCYADVRLPGAVFPDLEKALRQAQDASPSVLFQLFDGLTNHRSWRRLLGCHYYNHTDWFDRQDFDRFCLVLLQCRLYAAWSAATPRKALLDTVIDTLMEIRKLKRLAAKVGYRTDHLVCALQPESPLEKHLPAKRGGMKILFVASEAAPFAKSGGLADVAGSLPRALRLLGHDVHVVIPAYPHIDKAPVRPVKAPHSTEITLQGEVRRGSLKHAVYDGIPYWFIDAPDLFAREGLYAGRDGDYPDNGLRFGFFCRAVLEMARSLEFKPDMIHMNDWQTGLIPVLLKTSYRHDPFFAATRTLLTIHNLGYHGIFPYALLRQLELPGELANPSALEYYGNLSLLKGGIVFADAVNTVSPTYCQEIQTREQGYGFDGLLSQRRAKLFGILNGLDERLWNPATDKALPHHFTPRGQAGKKKCKKALQQELGLAGSEETPLVVIVSRLDRQKGIDLLEAVWPQLLQRSLQFVLLGSGTAEAMAFWEGQQGVQRQRASINLTFDEGLSRRLFAAADLLLVPSRYEPCGLTQMIALKYGALPLVRRTGGLADTVVDVDADPQQGNGFVFDAVEPQELLQTIDRALQLYQQQPQRWQELVRRGMRQDFSWQPSALRYQQLYRMVLAEADST